MKINAALTACLIVAVAVEGRPKFSDPAVEEVIAAIDSFYLQYRGVQDMHDDDIGWLGLLKPDGAVASGPRSGRGATIQRYRVEGAMSFVGASKTPGTFDIVGDGILRYKNADPQLSQYCRMPTFLEKEENKALTDGFYPLLFSPHKSISKIEKNAGYKWGKFGITYFNEAFVLTVNGDPLRFWLCSDTEIPRRSLKAPKDSKVLNYWFDQDKLRPDLPNTSNEYSRCQPYELLVAPLPKAQGSN